MRVGPYVNVGRGILVLGTDVKGIVAGGSEQHINNQPLPTMNMPDKISLFIKRLFTPMPFGILLKDD